MRDSLTMDKRTTLFGIVFVFVVGSFCILLLDQTQRGTVQQAEPEPLAAIHTRSSKSFARKADPIPTIYKERAARAFADYLELHRRIMDPKDSSVEKKFFINTRCSWGLGNFQIRAVGALLIAMLTKRAFVQQDPMYNSYYRYPVPDMTLSDEQLQERFGGSSQTASVCEPDKWDMCADFDDNWRDRANRSAPVNKFVKSSAKFFGGVPWFLYAHPVHGPWLRDTFGKYFFHFVGSFLLSDIGNANITAYLHHEQQRLYGPLGDPARQYRIGMQIRWGRGLDDFYLSDIHRDPDKFWRCAEPWLRENEANGKSGVIFLATDHMGIRNRTVEHFARRTPPVPVLHISAEVAPESAKHMALVDQYFLQDTDDMIVTQRSTFGFFPYAVGLHTPKVVHRIWPECQPFQDSQMGQVTRGGSWPWGTTICLASKCCADSLDGMTSLFGRLV
eukprot:TRINITY_DN3012_c0_g1_i1.p1 TRINITY_DN3012_c0_g1~~TRINITY_DN3012_c0_g1_i1.p1  ORF type:complete len:446 (-),score=127.06 TRINITY_DN3012_c0_g1_i1:192-1529(-)